MCSQASESFASFLPNALSANISKSCVAVKYITENDASIENLPFKQDNDMCWVGEFCKTCGKCIRKCPENAFDENELVLRKVCTAHREGCSQCMLVCPFYKKGYIKIKQKYDKRVAKNRG